ncbi:hypothetical protein D8I35_05830 [Corticibacter populi]|uniref:Uncharacterized protein n=1 Tax=Corticibacter populi TaxID=1550736 RepID=A0A3M6R118_9BURK|nr:hypothetical protein [Corticibacter populi]RMX08589.1 hypothetical protein D8I35_05830 [Corticibacter populi]RZS35913.1 hypothetical protein EV687_0995 [Corticibacter populi]
MNTSLLIISMLLGILGPWAALAYMRPILADVLRALCTTGQGVEFWLRSANVLAISGTLLLILSFGDFDAGSSVAGSLRRTTWLVLAGIFMTVAYITRSVRRQLPAADRVDAGVLPMTLATGAMPAAPGAPVALDATVARD